MSSLIADCSFKSLEEALKGLDVPAEIRETLVLVDVQYLSFDGCLHAGQLVVHKDLKEEVVEIFSALLHIGFPIEKVVPIVAYGWNDEASMGANNSSAFNYRLILGTDRLSNHSYGRAIDINPMQNPYFARDGKVHPVGATHNPSVPGTLTVDSEAVAIFKAKGWIWGGDWKVPVDFQHLEKPASQ